MSDYLGRDVEAEKSAGVDAFDQAYFERFGRYPDESAAAADPNPRRRQAIQALIEHGATEGERAAARAALGRLDTPSHAEHDRMQRGGNYVED
jgi:hypothetical protein